MIDENFAHKVLSHRHYEVSDISCMDIDMDGLYTNVKVDNQNRSSCNTSTSSPVSMSENAFSFNDSKLMSVDDKISEKKIHWNPSQMHSLLNCIEQRIDDFRKKSVQKAVWLSIGREMLEHGDFSVEHCYNKWKNLRRDVRLFNNANSMQKLSIRNAYVMERVQRMVSDIGYENSPRRGNSPISPHLDTVEDPLKLASVIISPVVVRAHPLSSGGNGQMEPPKLTKDDQSKSCLQATIEDSIISLLSDPSVSQTILTNPKLLNEILPGLDVATLLMKFMDSHPDMVPTSEIITNTLSNKSHCRKRSLVDENTVPLQSHTVTDVGNGWPYQLYELLHSFQDEEGRQMQWLDQIVGHVQGMQESTERRMSTINQLISLAGMLISKR